MNTISDLTESNTNSFQSISKREIKCCICQDVVLNHESVMPKCKHSWCLECNHQLNNNHINKCPLCKIKFKSQLRKGRWKFQIINHHMGYWVWEKGIEDSDRLTKFKKCQQFCLNFCGGVSMMTTINV